MDTIDKALVAGAAVLGISAIYIGGRRVAAQVKADVAKARAAVAGHSKGTDKAAPAPAAPPAAGSKRTAAGAAAPVPSTQQDDETGTGTKWTQADADAAGTAVPDASTAAPEAADYTASAAPAAPAGGVPIIPGVSWTDPSTWG